MTFHAVCNSVNENILQSFKSESAPCIKLLSLKKKESTLNHWKESFLKMEEYSIYCLNLYKKIKVCFIAKVTWSVGILSVTSLIRNVFLTAWELGPYDLRDAEITDGTTESSHKNRIYSLMRNVKEFVKV